MNPKMHIRPAVSEGRSNPGRALSIDTGVETGVEVDTASACTERSKLRREGTTHKIKKGERISKIGWVQGGKKEKERETAASGAG